jgi:cytoskeletal protein CcmA (bactofilin family)
MECYSQQTCALFVDGELVVDEARRLREHLAMCGRCRRLVDALREENRILGDSLREFPEEAPARSRLRRRWLWGDLAALTGVLALGSMILMWFDRLSLPAALEWFNPFSLSGRTNLFFDLSYYVGEGGTAMLSNYAAVIGWLCLLLLLCGAALLLGRRGRLRPDGLCVLMALLAFSLPGHALERRHSAFITVAANETVDDTLLAAANTVRVEGVINGDLLAFGRTVEVRGTVKGDLVCWAQRTEISGTVEGRIYNFSREFDLDGQLGHSLYGLMQYMRVADRAHVGEGILAGAGDVSLEGEVKRSVNIFTSNADVSGSVGRDLSMAGGRLTVTSTARIGGNLSARVRHVNDVHIADGATIAGKRDIQLNVRKSNFARPRFYVHQAIWLAAALLVGWLGLLLFPGFFRATTRSVGSGWLSLGLGIAILAGVPVAMIVIAITLVGLPISLMLLAVYLAGLYLAKIWVGAYLGRMLLKPSGASKGDWVLGLFVGLLILTLIGFIPYLGGLVRLGVVCLGLGAFVAQVSRASRTVMST